MTLTEKVDKAQAILDELVPKLKMEAMCDRNDHALILCPIHLSSYIRLAPFEIDVRMVRVRLLDMLCGLKDRIELDIQEIKNDRTTYPK